MKRIALAAALAALTSPAFSGNGTNVDLGAQLGLFGPDIEITFLPHCAIGSMGGCRRGIIGLIDEQQHGRCWIDRRSGRPTCDK